MTKFEFIQQATLAILGSGEKDITQAVRSAKVAAIFVFGLDEKAPDTSPVPERSGYEDSPWYNDNLTMLFAALDRYDRKERDEKNEDLRVRGFNNWYGLSGYRKRMLTVMTRTRINTVGALIEYSYNYFRREKNVGAKLAKAVCTCLKELYNIEAW
jgi:hypothetical protein